MISTTIYQHQAQNKAMQQDIARALMMGATPNVHSIIKTIKFDEPWGRCIDYLVENNGYHEALDDLPKEDYPPDDLVPILSNIKVSRTMPDTPITEMIDDYKVNLHNVTLYEQCSAILDDIGTQDPYMIIERLERACVDLKRNMAFGGVVTESELLQQTIEHIAKLKTGKIEILGTGFDFIDDFVHFNRGDLVVLAARPAVGKSSFMINMAGNLNKQNQPTFSIFMEMDNTAIGARKTAIETGIPHRDLRNSTVLNEAQQMKLQNYFHRDHSNVPGFYYDTPNLKYEDMVKLIKTTVKDHKVTYVFIDNLSLIRAASKFRDRLQEVSYITNSLKMLARECDIVLVILAHMNRSIESRGKNAAPQMSDIRESGTIEQDADNVFFLSEDGEEERGVQPITFTVKKARHGRTGLIDLNFDKPSQTFRRRI